MATPSRARQFRNAGLAVLGFVVVCASLRAILPFPEIGVVASHLRYFKKKREAFDTVFVGSSLTNRDISPAVFDRTMGERGHPTRSFNFGMDGMLVAEASYVLERLLETKPPHLRWVFIELEELETRPFGGAEGSRRDVYWRDIPRTSFLVRKLLDGDHATHSVVADAELALARAPRSDTPKLGELLLFHLRLFGKNIANVSRRVDLAWWSTHFWKPEKMPEDLGPNGDGFTPFPQVIPEDRMTGYEYALGEALRHSGERYISRATEQACWRMAEQVRKAGGTPVFLGMPVISQVKYRFRPETAPGTVLSFNDAKTYPQFYDRTSRAEEVHLNPKGAEELSRLVAEQVAALIEQDRIH